MTDTIDYMAIEDHKRFDNLMRFMKELHKISNRYGFAVDGEVHEVAIPGRYDGSQTDYGVEDVKWIQE